jgi:hypothetical protein
VLQRATSTALFQGRPAASSTLEIVPRPALTILRGRDAVLALQPRLAALAATTGQTGEADSLAYFLSTPEALKKTPCLLLIGDPTPGIDRLAAAVLLFEYRSAVGGTRVFATSDSTGRRNVLAPAGMRARTAAFAARTLVERGAHIVHLAFCEDHDACDRHRDSVTGVVASEDAAVLAEQIIATELKTRTSRRIQAEWTLREHNIPAYLPLLPTLDATLARIGQKTRSNLRYYRRRCEQELGSAFDAEPNISLPEFLAFNRECTYAVRDALAAIRYQAMTANPNQAMRGIRATDGRWLSLVGTRRYNGFVELDWQMNRAGLPASSLSTVMRAYLIEHEIALGSTRLYIEGGTPQFIAGSFLRLNIGELTVIRNSRYVGLLERFRRKVFPPKNYIGQTLRNPDLHWKRW